MMIRKLCAFAGFALIAGWCTAANYVVTNTNDAGVGSLRQAISDVNIMPGSHSITFNIPTSDPNYVPSQGVWKISPTSTLPMVMRSNLLIDGNSQTTNQGNTNPDGPEILLDGNHAFGSDYALHLYNVSGVIVQGFIIGRFTVGVEISGSNSQNITIRGNYIGCNYNATDTLSNTQGIEILSGPHNITIGGSTLEDRNIISGNNHIGVRVVNSNSNIIKGNYIGLNRTGTAAVRNYDGISMEGTSKYNLIGGVTAADRNYVSGNVAYGMLLFGAGCNYNTVSGNYSGTDITGTYSIPNTYGFLFDDGASFNTLGGRTPGAGNLLSGNSAYGVFIYNPGTQRDTVVGNLIGTNAAGTAALPNANGIVIDGPSFRHYVDSNVISGNLQMGIDIHIGGSDSNVVIRNFIGTDYSGTIAIPNAMDGVRLGEGPKNNIIGMPGKGNIIANNGGNGVSVMTTAELYNSISANSIYNNTGLGIDLFPEGVTPNDAGDADSGPNDALNFPVIDSVYFIWPNTYVKGHIDVPAPITTRIELFVAMADASGYGQGKDYLGYTYAIADGSWITSLPGIIAEEQITTTATDALGNTSEFSLNYSSPQAGLPENTENYADITAYPNPFSEGFNLEINGSQQFMDALQVKIYSCEGRLLMTSEISSTKHYIEASLLPSGLYFCHIQYASGRSSVIKISKR